MVKIWCTCTDKFWLILFFIVYTKTLQAHLFYTDYEMNSQAFGFPTSILIALAKWRNLKLRQKNLANCVQEKKRALYFYAAGHQTVSAVVFFACRLSLKKQWKRLREWISLLPPTILIAIYRLAIHQWSNQYKNNITTS